MIKKQNPMAISDFTDHNDIQDGIASLKKIKVSDIIDEQGNQYVDLVQEGGGVLGIALVGYTYVLEQLGIRFFSLAGTSAGAINTMMLAGLGPIREPKSERILEIMNNKNLFDLVDGDKSIKNLIQRAIKKEGGIGWKLALNALKIYRILKQNLGANPGNDFMQWIDGELAKNGVNNLNDLETLRGQLPDDIRHVKGENVKDLVARLAIITSDVTTATKVEFPRMADMYWKSAGEISPAKIVRASMSIPFFFEPFSADDVPNAGKKNDPLWAECAGYSGEVPKKVLFVDGGLLSNFPINVFHRPLGSVPRKPTFGVRLSAYRESYNRIDSIYGFSGAMISTMRQIYDYDFLLKNPDYSQVICRIDADQEFNWLDFNMEHQQKVELFRLGALKAIEFMKKFNWEQYKETRRKMSEIHAPAKPVTPEEPKTPKAAEKPVATVKPKSPEKPVR
jgi:NTE family protein